MRDKLRGDRQFFEREETRHGPDDGAHEAEHGRNRDLGAGLRTKIYPPNVKGWALIVGISHYRHLPWNLEYAHGDAEKFAEVVRAEAGGKFTEVNLLVDERATYAELNALRSFLKRPDKDDIVPLYFACHGAPIYLLTHDTDPQDISGTALPMREIDIALKETQPSGRRLRHRLGGASPAVRQRHESPCCTRLLVEADRALPPLG